MKKIEAIALITVAAKTGSIGEARCSSNRSRKRCASGPASAATTQSN